MFSQEAGLGRERGVEEREGKDRKGLQVFEFIMMSNPSFKCVYILEMVDFAIIKKNVVAIIHRHFLCQILLCANAN